MMVTYSNGKTILGIGFWSYILYIIFLGLQDQSNTLIISSGLYWLSRFHHEPLLGAVLLSIWKLDDKRSNFSTP